jgi:integrase
LSTDLVRFGDDEISRDVAELIRNARENSTVAQYASALRVYRRAGGVLPATDKDCVEYVATLVRNGKGASTINTFVAAVKWLHRLKGWEPIGRSVLFHETLLGARNAVARAPRRAAALKKEELKELVTAFRDAGDYESACLLLVGFVGGRRRSEIAGLKLRNVAVCDDGMVVTFDKTKTQKKGETIALPYSSDPALCPVRALLGVLRARLGVPGVGEESSIFTVTAPTFGRRLRAILPATGIDPTRARTITLHSLRAGHITRAAQQGVPEWAIMLQTGHRSTDVLRDYVRSARMFVDSSATKLGL